VLAAVLSVPLMCCTSLVSAAMYDNCRSLPGHPKVCRSGEGQRERFVASHKDYEGLALKQKNKNDECQGNGLGVPFRRLNSGLEPDPA
jgi:hypothetical protein